MNIWERVYRWLRGFFFQSVEEEKGKGPKPGKVRNVNVEVDMKNAHITWTDPAERGSGQPVILDNIAVSLSADLGQNFSAPVAVAPGVQAFDYFDLGDAEYIVRLVVVDTAGRQSAPVDTGFVIDNSDPNPVENVQITFS